MLLAGVLALENADTATVGAVATPLEHALHFGNTRLGLLLTVSTGIGALATLPVGMFVDRVPRVRLLAAAIVIWSMAMVVSGLASSFAMLLVTRLALGLVVATAGPAVASLTGDLFPPGERGRIYGYILSGELAGAGVGFLVSGDIAGWVSWRASFMLLAVPGLALAWTLLRLLPEPARGGRSRIQAGATEIAADDDGDSPSRETDPGDHTGDDADDDPVVAAVTHAGVRPRGSGPPSPDPEHMSLGRAVAYILSIPTNRLLIVASSLGYFFFSGLRAFAVEYMRGRFDLGQSTASALLVMLGAGALVGVLAGGRVADWLTTAHHRIAARPLVSGLAFLLAAGLFVPSLLVPSLVLAAPVTFLAAAAYGATNPPLDASRLDVVHHRLWGRAEATRTVLRSLFEAAAPVAFGYVSTLFGGHGGGLSAGANSQGHATGSSTGLQPTFLIMLAPLVVAGVLLAVRARRDYPVDVATAQAWERSPSRATFGV